ncbi:MAG: TM2 domain-containing protein [Saprospiraceae bacterium]|nr:TM2 domain-containing protein [Saprospiraceae bacterium]
MKNRFIAAILGFMVGFLGIHKFYLGRTFQGFLHLITGPIGWAIAVIEAFGYLRMGSDEFDIRYNFSAVDKKNWQDKRKLEQKRLELETRRLERQELLEEELFRQELEEAKRNAELKRKQQRPINAKMADNIAAWDELRRKGIISDQEFELKKEQIILGRDD